VKSFKTLIAALRNIVQHTKRSNASNGVSQRIVKQGVNTEIAAIVCKHHHQHKSSMTDARVRKHPFNTVLHGSSKVCDDERKCNHYCQGSGPHKTCTIKFKQEQSHYSGKCSGFNHCAHQSCNKSGRPFINIRSPEMKWCCCNLKAKCY